MDASVSFVASGLDSYGEPPVLIAASSEAAASRASEVADGANLPFVSVSLEELLPRLQRQASAQAIWLEIESDGGAELDRILERIDAEAASDRFPAIIARPSR